MERTTRRVPRSPHGCAPAAVPPAAAAPPRGPCRPPAQTAGQQQAYNVTSCIKAAETSSRDLCRRHAEAGERATSAGTFMHGAASLLELQHHHKKPYRQHLHMSRQRSSTAVKAVPKHKRNHTMKTISTLAAGAPPTSR